MPPEPSAAISLNALMMPRTVPSSPTKGAVEPVDASTFIPRFRSRLMASPLRSSARRVSSAARSASSPAWRRVRKLRMPTSRKLVRWLDGTSEMF